MMQKLEQLCSAIDLISGRDTEKTVLEVLRAFIEEDGPLGSSKVSKITGLNRLTCLHHMKRLEHAKLLKKINRFYMLNDFDEIFDYYEGVMRYRIQLMQKLINEIEKFRED